MAEFNWQSIEDALNQNNVPEIALIILGVVALLVVYTYVKDKDSALYKLFVLLGVIAGAVMVYILMAVKFDWVGATKIIAIIGCFALIIRPFRDVNFSLILSAIVMVAVYVWLGTLAGTAIEIGMQSISLDPLASGWPRIIVAIVAGSIVYMITGFIQALAQLAGKILNAWPLLAVVGIVCIVEAICLLSGNGTIWTYISEYLNGTTESMLTALL